MKKILILFLGFLFISCIAEEQKKAPVFSLKTVNNEIINLSDYKGKVVIVNFFATWCPPCKREIPDFVKFYNENKDKGIVVIGICVGSKEQDIKKLIEEYKISYPVCISDGKVENAYGGINAVPTTFIIDRNGFIFTKQIGMMEEEQLYNILKQIK
ncbi:MAG TPA: TlpA disulfide reductase family protein [Candidatus Ratteibacteria bacterium]|nr:TlpA disulfide reductase family protein [Candidatus Ratteibacteria bacterium]